MNRNIHFQVVSDAGLIFEETLIIASEIPLLNEYIVIPLGPIVETLFTIDDLLNDMQRGLVEVEDGVIKLKDNYGLIRNELDDQEERLLHIEETFVEPLHFIEETIVDYGDRIETIRNEFDEFRDVVKTSFEGIPAAQQALADERVRKAQEEGIATGGFFDKWIFRWIGGNLLRFLESVAEEVVAVGGRILDKAW